MKRIFISALAVIISVLTLSSCALFGGKDSGGENPPISEEKGKFAQIVVSDMELDILNIRYGIFDLLGPMAVVTPDEAAKKREIVFGDTARPITAAAKAELAKLKSGKSGADFGYIIYSDGNSVAVYWEHENLLSLALNSFNKICINEKKLVIDSGTIASATFSNKDIERDVKWLAIEAAVDPELYRALRNFASEFDGTRMAEWLANLWDDNYGGFYYSNSARDFAGYLPDIESTAQCLSFLLTNKAFTDANKDLPNELKIKIVDFFLTRQSSTDGYFYHPQWPQDKSKLSSDRYGRDLSSATGWIQKLTVDRDGDGVEEKVYPNYCTPNGMKCKEHELGGSCQFIGLARFDTAHGSSTVSEAVARIENSTVKPTASISNPDFSSSEAFTRWLDGVMTETKTKPGTTSHYINALSAEIISKGYADELMDYLDKIQEEVYQDQVSMGETPSGFWSYEADASLAMAIHKYMSAFYNVAGIGREFKYYKEAINTCIEILLLPADDCALNDLMNRWISITHIFNNVKKYNPDDVAALYDMVRARGAELVQKANDNLEANRIGDYMYAYYHGMSMVSLYGVNISLGLREADVNGALLLGNYYNAVFNCLNIPVVNLCSSDDGKLFVDTVMNAEPIVKKELAHEDEIDFDDNSVLTKNTVKIVKNTDGGKIEIIEEPTGDYGKILSFTSPIGSPSGDFLVVAASSSGGNCNIAEFDYFCYERSRDGQLHQILIGDGMMLSLVSDGQYISLVIISDGGATPIRDVLVSYDDKIRIDQWHRFRFEVYDPDEGETAPNVKCFVDETLMKESRLFFGAEKAGEPYKFAYGWFKIYSMASIETTIYVDNIYCSRELKTYIEGDNDISDIRGK